MIRGPIHDASRHRLDELRDVLAADRTEYVIEAARKQHPMSQTRVGAPLAAGPSALGASHCAVKRPEGALLFIAR